MKVVSTANAPAAIGPYSQALDLGNMVFVSGQLPVDPATGTMADTVEQQAAQSLANLKAILAEAGLSMNNVVKTVIFLADTFKQREIIFAFDSQSAENVTPQITSKYDLTP